VKLKDLLAARRSRRRRPRSAPRHIVPPADPFDAARARLKAAIPPRRDE
jgi:hypothetical protein